MESQSSDDVGVDLTSFIADIIASGAPIIKNGVRRTKLLASGNTFTVYSGVRGKEVVAIKDFNFEAPLSNVSIEVAGESLREKLGNASYEIRIMANGILRRCPNITRLQGVIFESEDPSWIRPALVVDLADEKIGTSLMKICHGDIKPDNVLIFPSIGDSSIPYEAKVSDFGFAFVSGQKPRGTGTVGWAAPECLTAMKNETFFREKAYGRDVFSAALVMQVIIASLTPKEADEQATGQQLAHSANEAVLRRMKLELEPRMLQGNPESRPWIEDLRKDLMRICGEEGVEHLLWSWVASEHSMTQVEIEPISTSAQLKGQICTWLLNKPEIDVLSDSIKNALLREIRRKARDPTDENRADSLNALFLCYHLGRLVPKDSHQARNYMWESARAGSTTAQGEAMHYIAASHDYSTTTTPERQEWSLATLTHKHRYGWDLISLIDAKVCEKGLRAAVFANFEAVQRRLNRRKFVRPVAQVLKDSLKTEQMMSLDLIIPIEVLPSMVVDDLDNLAKLIEMKIEDVRLVEALLRSLLEYALEAHAKQLLFMLISRFNVDLTSKDPATGHSALSISIFEDRNDVVIWMLDSGIDRSIFGSQHIFGRVVCNSTYTMTNTYIQSCHTYYKDMGVKRLLNEGAPNMDGSKLPIPIALAILSGNSSSFEVLMRYDTDIEQRFEVWTPLLLCVTRGLPLLCAMLIEKGASLDSVTNDEMAMGIVHVLASSEVFASSERDAMLYEIFDRPRVKMFLSLVTQSQEKRFADHLIFSILKQFNISFNTKDALGRTPLHLAIESGNIWIAAFLDSTGWITELNSLGDLSKLQDFQGRTLLFYAIEDDEYDLAECLIRVGLQIETSEHKGKTVLHEAAEQNDIKRLDFCIRLGASVACLDLLGRTCLTFAIAHGNISMCKQILSKGGPTILLSRTAADETFVQQALKSNEDAVLSFLIDYYLEHQTAGGLPSISEIMGNQDLQGRTPLHDACHPRIHNAANVSTASLFSRIISLSPKISTPDNIGDTPLHDAVETADKHPHSFSCASALVDAGASINAQNHFGNTPLHYAYQRQQQKSIDLLIRSGADCNLKNKQGFSPEEWQVAIRDDSTVGREADRAAHDMIHRCSKWRIIQAGTAKSEKENAKTSKLARLAFIEENAVKFG